MIRKCVFFVAVFGVAIPAIFGQTLDDLMKEEMQRRHILGAAVVVVKAGKVTVSRGFGVADQKMSTPVTPRTIFYIGSVTKQFTATVIMRSVESGQLQLDDTAARYLAGLPPAYSTITIRQLLSHTSGIRRDLKMHGNSLIGDELYRQLASAPLDFKPGEKASYSTTNYILLGMVLEQVHKKPLAKIFAQQIFQPLGMDVSSLTSGSAPRKGIASGYEWNDGSYTLVDFIPKRYAAGDVVSSAQDMAKWDAALRGAKTLSKKSLDEMWTPVKLLDGNLARIGTDDAGRILNAGLGWFISDVNGHRLVHHGGNIDGYSAQIDRYVDDDITIVVLCNNESGTATGLAAAVAKIYLPTKH